MHRFYVQCTTPIQVLDAERLVQVGHFSGAALAASEAVWAEDVPLTNPHSLGHSLLAKSMSSACMAALDACYCLDGTCAKCTLASWVS